MNRKFLLFVSLIIAACNGGIRDNFLGNYYLVAPDADEQTALSYHEQSDGLAYGDVISATVFAIGYSKTFIIAKQHPNYNKQIVNYFILPVRKGFDWKTKNGLIGPLTSKQFEQKKTDLRIQDIKFTIVYKDLE